VTGNVLVSGTVDVGNKLKIDTGVLGLPVHQGVPTVRHNGS
jgi:hypothetical protein